MSYGKNECRRNIRGPSSKKSFKLFQKYEGKTWKWDTIILNKTQELARSLLGKSRSLDFTEPAPSLVRTDSRELRKRIFDLPAKKARKLGISKSTFHYLHRHARNERPFKVYEKVANRLLNSIESSRSQTMIRPQFNQKNK